VCEDLDHKLDSIPNSDNDLLCLMVYIFLFMSFVCLVSGGHFHEPVSYDPYDAVDIFVVLPV
jgi:hypothetical protein